MPLRQAHVCVEGPESPRHLRREPGPLRPSPESLPRCPEMTQLEANGHCGCSQIQTNSTERQRLRKRLELRRTLQKVQVIRQGLGNPSCSVVAAPGSNSSKARLSRRQRQEAHKCAYATAKLQADLVAGQSAGSMMSLTEEQKATLASCFAAPSRSYWLGGSEGMLLQALVS